MKRTFKYAGAATAAGLLALLAAPAFLHAAEVDLSCMTHEVRGKIQVSVHSKEYDLRVHNRCPDPVYWALCIERIDPLSHEIIEVHTPGGYLEAEQSTRVNLQLKPGPERMAFRKRFQEFYVDAGYAIDATAAAECPAAACEAQWRDLRKRLDANTAAWEKAGGGSTEGFAATEAELRGQLQDAALQRCRVHGGDLAM